jgi:hypothetical protein
LKELENITYDLILQLARNSYIQVIKEILGNINKEIAEDIKKILKIKSGNSGEDVLLSLLMYLDTKYLNKKSIC